MRLKSFSYALSRPSWEFHYPTFFYEGRGSDFLLVSFVRSPATWPTNFATDQGLGGVDSKTCSGSWLGTDAGMNRLRNSGRARGSSSPSRRKAKRSENSWLERAGNLDKAGSRRRRTGAIGPVLCVRSAATPAWIVRRRSFLAQIVLRKSERQNRTPRHGSRSFGSAGS